MDGEPYTWRRVRTVRGQAIGNLSPQGGKAPIAEPTDNERENQSEHGSSFPQTGKSGKANYGKIIKTIAFIKKLSVEFVILLGLNQCIN